MLHLKCAKVRPLCKLDVELEIKALGKGKSRLVLAQACAQQARCVLHVIHTYIANTDSVTLLSTTITTRHESESMSKLQTHLQRVKLQTDALHTTGVAV